MLSKHGVLESAILSALWELEERGSYTNSVKDVFNFMNEKNEDKRAYTTIKTVMDRLFEKNILMRIKQGKKFCYKTTFSNNEAIVDSLKEIAERYCNGDLIKLTKVLNSMNEKVLISA